MKFAPFFRRRAPILSSPQAYARWAASYPPLAHNPFMQLEESTLLDMLPDVRGLRILDLACGSGRWGRIALERGAAGVISLDESPPMLRAGMPSLPSVARMAALPLATACVEGVICGLAIGHVPQVHFRAALSEMRRVLAAGGFALISDVHPVQMWAGGQRTFQHGGKTFAVEHHIHSYADYHAACHALGLTIEEVREAAVADGQPPVLLALRLRK